MIGIYKITNKQNGKVYIGQASNIERRLREHRQRRTQTIDNYINVLGVDNFTFEVLEECNADELDMKEQQYIDIYDSINNGYNYQSGGFNSSIGSGNGRAKLTEDIVIKMREAYDAHTPPKEFYEKIKYTGISESSFQSAWQGQSWSNIMPEVFTEENKLWYIRKYQQERNSIFSKEDVIKYRTYYINHNAFEVYQQVIKDKGENFTTLGTVKKMLCGDGKNNNFYQQIPIYSKKRHRWELNNEPVSTIHESGE